MCPHVRSICALAYGASPSGLSTFTAPKGLQSHHMCQQYRCSGVAPATPSGSGLLVTKGSGSATESGLARQPVPLARSWSLHGLANSMEPRQLLHPQDAFRFSVVLESRATRRHAAFRYRWIAYVDRISGPAYENYECHEWSGHRDWFDFMLHESTPR